MLIKPESAIHKILRDIQKSGTRNADGLYHNSRTYNRIGNVSIYVYGMPTTTIQKMINLGLLSVSKSETRSQSAHNHWNNYTTITYDIVMTNVGDAILQANNNNAIYDTKINGINHIKTKEFQAQLEKDAEHKFYTNLLTSKWSCTYNDISFYILDDLNSQGFISFERFKNASFVDSIFNLHKKDIIFEDLSLTQLGVSISNLISLGYPLTTSSSFFIHWDYFFKKTNELYNEMSEFKLSDKAWDTTSWYRRNAIQTRKSSLGHAWANSYRYNLAAKGLSGIDSLNEYHYTDNHIKKANELKEKLLHHGDNLLTWFNQISWNEIIEMDSKHSYELVRVLVNEADTFLKEAHLADQSKHFDDVRKEIMMMKLKTGA